MENLTKIERGLIVLALQGLVMRQPQVMTEVLVIVEKLGLMDQLTKSLQSWIAWSTNPLAVPPPSQSMALCPDDGRVTSWGHPLDEPQYIKPDGTIDWAKLMGGK